MLLYISTINFKNCYYAVSAKAHFSSHFTTLRLLHFSSQCSPTNPSSLNPPLPAQVWWGCCGTSRGCGCRSSGRPSTRPSRDGSCSTSSRPSAPPRKEPFPQSPQPPGTPSSPPCLSTPSSSPTSVAPGTSTCWCSSRPAICSTTSTSRSKR